MEIGLRFGPAVAQRKSSGPFLTHLKDFGVQPFGLSVTNINGPAEVQLNKGPLGKYLAQSGSCGEVNIELEFLSMREKEAEREQQVDFHYLLTDNALVEEVSRYGSLSNSGGLRDSRTPSHSFLFSFGLIPGGEFFLSFWGVKGALPEWNCVKLPRRSWA